MKDKKTRDEIELLAIQVFDALDKSKKNSEYLQEKFAKMSDTQFWNFMERRFPFQFQYNTWETEPTFANYKKALELLGQTLTSKICLPYLYKNKDGVPVNSKETLPMVLMLKRVQQFAAHKTNISPDIEARDMKTGRLTTDKGAATSDRECQSMITLGLYNNAKEFTSLKADSMDVMAQSNQQILNTGTLSMNDLDFSIDDSISRHLLYYMLLGCHRETNLVGESGYTPYTMSQRRERIKRES